MCCINSSWMTGVEILIFKELLLLCFAPTCYSSLLQGPSFTPVFFLQLYEVFVITWSRDNMASSMALCLDEVGRDDDSLERGHA